MKAIAVSLRACVPTACQVTVTITGPNGFSAAAERIKVRSSRRGSVALYRLAAPGGVFDAADDGAYTVLLGDAVLRQFRVAAAR